MPVLETDFLKGIIDPEDELHDHSMKARDRVREGKWHVASSAFLELDLLLKGTGISRDDRKVTFEMLCSEISISLILPLTHRTISEAITIRKDNPDVSRFYFDSLHVATACMLDGEIVSSDATFDDIEGIERIELEKL